MNCYTSTACKQKFLHGCEPPRTRWRGRRRSKQASRHSASWRDTSKLFISTLFKKGRPCPWLPSRALSLSTCTIHISFFHHWFFGTWKYITKILTIKARPKKTRTTRIHFRRYPTSITAPVSWISAFLMHSLLIYGGSILRASFFFECKEVDVSSLYSIKKCTSLISSLYAS